MLIVPPAVPQSDGVNSPYYLEWAEGEESIVDQDGNTYDSDITPAQSNSPTLRTDFVDATLLITSQPMEVSFFANASPPHGRG